MLVKTFQIVWHDKLPVLSCEFHRSGCLVTSGADHEIKVWNIQLKGEKDLNVAFQGSISNHSRAVNCVRFHGDRLASAGDGGEVMVWAPPPDAEDKSLVHTWKVCQLLRGHADDVVDLAWSTDGSGVVTTSIDNTVILWDTAKGKRKKCFSGHRHYVQGVAWDPLGEHILTHSTDRTMRVHKARAGKKQARADATDVQAAADFVQTSSVFKRPLTAAEEKHQPQQPSAPKDTSNQQVAAPDTCTPPSGVPPQKAQRKAANSTFIFQDEGLNTFFRRLSFSPEGSILVAPAATLGPLAPAPRCSNAAALFSRQCFSKPLALLPTLVSASTCVRFCPTFFQRGRSSSGGSAQENQPPAPDRSPFPAGGQSGAAEDKSPVQLPYKLVYAIGTTDSIFIYDTEDVRPLLVLGAVHLKHVTDLAWSPCGCFLAATSHDGYCTISHFEPNELGVPLKSDIPDAQTIRLDMQRQRQTKTKPSKPKKAAGAATAAKPKSKPVAATLCASAGTGPQQTQLPHCKPPAATDPSSVPQPPVATVTDTRSAPEDAQRPEEQQQQMQQGGPMEATEDNSNQPKSAAAQQCVDNVSAEDQDVSMLDFVEAETAPSIDCGLSVAQLAAQAGQAASFAAR